MPDTASLTRWTYSPPPPAIGPQPECPRPGCTAPVLSVEPTRDDGSRWYRHADGIYHVTNLPLPIEWTL